MGKLANPIKNDDGSTWDLLSVLTLTHNYSYEDKGKIVLDVELGDTILVGEFKNKKVSRKDIGKGPPECRLSTVEK